MPVSRVSFIVVNFNGGRMLEQCLESIKSQTFRDYEVIVVDNGSTDGSCDLPFFGLDGWQLVRLDRNAGFSEANNIGLDRSSGAYIALVNNDAVLCKSWAEKMVEVMDKDDSAGAVACKIVKQDDHSAVESFGFSFHTSASCSSWHAEKLPAGDHPGNRPFGAVATAALYRRAAIERTDFFNPEYFAYYEDTDLAVRMVLHGYTCGYSPDAVAYHAGSVTGRRHSDFHRYHLRRNIELLYWVDMVGILAARNLLPHLFYETLCFGGMAIKGQALVFLKAKWDALKMLPWIIRRRRELRMKLDRNGSFAQGRRDLQERMVSVWMALLARRSRG